MLGDCAEKLYTAIRDGVPTNASAKESAALFSVGRFEPTDADRSSTSATSIPHCTGSGGFARDCCHTPFERVFSELEELNMKSEVDRYVPPAASAGVWKR